MNQKQEEMNRLKVLEASLRISRDQMQMAIDSDYDFRMMDDSIDEQQQLRLFKEQLSKVRRQMHDLEDAMLVDDYEIVYVPTIDVTLIVKQSCDDYQDGIRLINYYYGEPNDKDTAYYSYQYNKFKDCLQETIDFKQHIEKYIKEMPLGGYNHEMSTVRITVGNKTLDTYDHAALIQSLLAAMEELTEELN